MWGRYGSGAVGGWGTLVRGARSMRREELVVTGLEGAPLMLRREVAVATKVRSKACAGPRARGWTWVGVWLGHTTIWIWVGHGCG